MLSRFPPIFFHSIRHFRIQFPFRSKFQLPRTHLILRWGVRASSPFLGMAASMAPGKLTEGGVMVICKRESTAEAFQPVVQVIDLKLVNTAQQSGSERYRLLLSDGTHYQQGMLGTQLNELVKSGKLQKGSIVRLRQYVCNPVQERL